MATKVLVPLLGEGVEEVTVTKWLKQEGDSIDELEPLLEVNTDKVDTEIPAPASGVVLKIQMEEGAVAKVGEVLAVIGQAGETVTSEQLSKSSEAPKTELQPEIESPAAPSTVHRPPSADLGFISPVVAKIAAEHGVNLQNVPGTGLNGRITKKDVLKFVESGKQTTDHRPQTMVNRPPSVVAPAQGDQLIKHSTIRKQIAEHMVMSPAHLPACTDRHGSGHVEDCCPSQGQQRSLRERWRQADLHRLLHAGHRGGTESLSERQLILDGRRAAHSPEHQRRHGNFAWQGRVDRAGHQRRGRVVPAGDGARGQ